MLVKVFFLLLGSREAAGIAVAAAYHLYLVVQCQAILREISITRDSGRTGAITHCLSVDGSRVIVATWILLS